MWLCVQKQSGRLAVNVNLILSIEESENEYVVIPVEAEIPLNYTVKVVTENIPMVKKYTYIKSAPDEDMVLKKLKSMLKEDTILVFLWWGLVHFLFTI